MQHICYHVISENKNEFFNGLSDVKDILTEWEKEGESNFKVFKIVTEEIGSDEISLAEESINLSEISNN